jgi:putative hydrolase of the HAD superfamily
VTVSTPITAVLWDFGGVILSSPFEAFNRFETERDIPLDTIRGLNATDPDTNAWARFERNEISTSEFDSIFAAEAEAIGYHIRGYEVLSLLRGDIRPDMVKALDLVAAAGYKTACLTNNMIGSDGFTERPSTDREREIDLVMERFDAIVESSKVGCRKPERRFYEMACELLHVEPANCVFLDDLGINLKPAAAMGMTTIKVLSADQALTDLEAVLKMSLR